MDLRQLRYFVRVADGGSFRRAAERTHVAQSALSRHVRELEAELGVALFERHARGVDLTAAGVRLRDRAAAILRDVAELRAELMSRSEVPRGTVTIGASSTTSRLLYGRLAEAAARRLPRVSVDMLEGASYFLLEGLDTGRIDLALMVNPEAREYFAIESLVVETVYLICAAEARALPGGPCSVGDLAGLPLVLFSRPSGSRTSVEAAAAAEGLALDVRFEAASPDVVKDIVRRGLGYGLMPRSSIHREVAAGELRAVECRGLELARAAVRRADRPAPPAAAPVMDLVREEFRALASEGVFGAAA